MSVLTRSIVVLIGCAATVVTAEARAQGQAAQEPPRDDVQGLIASGLYERAESAARSTVERMTRTTGSDSLETAVASDWLVRAMALNGKASLPATIALAEQIVRIKESRKTAPRVDLAESLINLGGALGEGAAHARAIPILERAVALRRSAGGIPLALALDALGAELTRASRYEEALSTLRQSLAIKEGASADAITLVETLNGITLVMQQTGQLTDARTSLQRALTSRGRGHPVHVTTLILLGQQLWLEGSWVDGREASASAVSLAERTLRADHPTTAVALRYLAATLLDLGDIARAKSLQERALGIVERSLGARHHEVAPLLNALGDSTMLLGDYLGARAQYERALTIVETRLGTNHVWVASVVHNLALVDAHLGDYASARQREARAIAIWERAFGRDDRRVAVALMQLADVARDEGAATEALPLLERALAIRQRRLGAEHRDVAATLADLAITLVQLRQVDRAQILASQALAILQRADAAAETPDLASMLDLYAQLQARRGDSRTARSYFERALTIKTKIFGASHPVVAETQARLAVSLAALGQSSAAFTMARAAESTGRGHLRLMLRYLPERQSLNYAATRPRGLDLIVSLSGTAPDGAAMAFDEAIRSRALVLDEMARRRSSLGASADGSGTAAADLTRARQRLVNLVVRGPGDLTAERYTTLVEDARRDSEREERLLAERSAAFSDELQRSQLGLNDVRKALPPNSALVSFVRYERLNLDAATAGSTPPAVSSTTAYVAFILTAAGRPIAIPLGPAQAIDTLVAQWRTTVAEEAFGGTAPWMPRRSSRPPGTELRRLIWDPIAARLTNVQRVFIVPDGTLSLVPFAALPVQQSGYLIEDAPLIHYLSAERDLTSFVAPSRPRQGLLAIGGPAFDDRMVFGGRLDRPAPNSKLLDAPANRAVPTECDSLQHITFPKLDGSLQEVQEVAKLWRIPESSSARVLIGREASEHAFKEEASRYRVLHLATHGFFLGDGCARSRDSVRSTSAAAGPPAAEIGRGNPLLLSGLALAGANRRAAARPDEDDGILTAAEVASLNLNGVEWAVLSACDTGLGEIKAGEGVFGLRRAFQIAGARTVIMSLWSVDDQATREWMRALYEGRFQKKLDTANAVHTASLTVLRDRRARGLSTVPFYWAAFVAAGDWR